MKALIAISFGELFLKGSNRKYFYNNALRHIKMNLEDFTINNMYTESAKLYIDIDEDKIDRAIDELLKIFGLSYVDKVYRVSKDVDDIYEAVKVSINENYDSDHKSFRVDTTRVDKSFPYKSPELSAIIGEKILDDYQNYEVDLHNADFRVHIDIKNEAYVYSKRNEGEGGLPIGSSGHGLLLLSGGIDSPVAGYLMAKRGMRINALHFHSYPFTSKRAQQKAVDLAKIMSTYTGPMNLYMINLSEIYQAIASNCPRRETTVISRRFMVRIAEELSKANNYQALITGDSLGQVASQTIESMNVIDDATDMTMLRPLVAMDKKDIITISKKIDSYDKSIEPYDDCCSIFAPDKPVTKPKLHFIQMSEENLDIDKLVQKALETIEVIEI